MLRTCLINLYPYFVGAQVMPILAVGSGVSGIVSAESWPIADVGADIGRCRYPYIQYHLQQATFILLSYE